VKKYGISILLCLSLFLLGACSDSTKAPKNTKDKYSVTQAAKDGNVVIQNMSNNFAELAQGAVKVKNLDKAFSFMNSFSKGKKSSLKVSIFNKDGEYYTNEISYNGTDITVDNKYGGYKLPPGKYQCKSFTSRNAISYLESCKDEKGKEISTAIAIISDNKSYNDAEQKANTQ